MKKLLTLGVALLTSFSLWAVDPTFESYDWATSAEAAAVAGDHDGIVISYAGLGSPSSMSGHYYIPMSQNLKNSDASWKYFGVSSTQKIDSISVLYSPNGSNPTNIAWVAWGENVDPNQYVLAHGVTAGTTSSKSWDNAIWETIDLSAVEDAHTVYLSRSVREFREIGATSNLANFGGGQTVNILGIRVWTHESKEVDHVEVSLGGVAVNGVALSEIEMATLYGAQEFDLTTEYVEAPTVTFIKQTDTYYVGEATPSTKNENINVVATLGAGKWAASCTLGELTYTVTAIKPATATVTYMDGETVLGTETVKKGDPATKYGEYEVNLLAVFGGWYNDAELTDPVDMTTFAVNNDLTVHGKFLKSYAESVNFENNVMNNGKSFDIIGLLGTSGYATDITGSLDSLDNSKTDGLRNYAYLGLKVKQNGAALNFWIKNGSTVKIKFGNIAKTPLVSINGGEYADMSITDKVYTHTAAADELISIKMADANAVVFQQIMIDEELRSPELFAINCAEATNGTVAAPYKLGIPNETITLTVTPDAGYKIATVTVNGDELVDVEGAYSFTMPGQDVNVVATFEVSTGVSDAAADADAAKPTKRLVDGVLLIEKDGVTYSAQGGILK